MSTAETEPAKHRLSEDWLAVIVGGVLLSVCLGAVGFASLRVQATADPEGLSNPFAPYLAAPAKWSQSPIEAISGKWLGVLGVGVATLAAFSAAVWLGGERVGTFMRAFVGLFVLALVAYVMSRQTVVAYYGFAYMLWAIAIGLVIANTVGTPDWLRPALRGELITKVGLVLLGAEVLLGRLVALGLPGVCVAWIVTPVVLCTTFWFGRRVLRIASPSLVMVVAADMSVCGVSAAIATAAACRAKKEELSLAIGLSLFFTAIMMVVLPAAVVALGLSTNVGGAWIGGTIDSTGAVAAAGALLGDEGLQVAATIKMIQNVLVGVTAFAVATYWVTSVESEPGAKPELIEVWRRFPKFILGFLGASIVFSLLSQAPPNGEEIVATTISGATKTLRNWCFCLAFTAIGLDTNFRELAGALRGGKPVVLYLCGQSLNLVLTLAMAYLMFGVLFAGAGDAG